MMPVPSLLGEHFKKIFLRFIWETAERDREHKLGQQAEAKGQADPPPPATEQGSLIRGLIPELWDLSQRLSYPCALVSTFEIKLYAMLHKVLKHIRDCLRTQTKLKLYLLIMRFPEKIHWYTLTIILCSQKDINVRIIHASQIYVLFSSKTDSFTPINTCLPPKIVIRMNKLNCLLVISMQKDRNLFVHYFWRKNPSVKSHLRGWKQANEVLASILRTLLRNLKGKWSFKMRDSRWLR